MLFRFCSSLTSLFHLSFFHLTMFKKLCEVLQFFFTVRSLSDSLKDFFFFVMDVPLSHSHNRLISQECVTELLLHPAVL